VRDSRLEGFVGVNGLPVSQLNKTVGKSSHPPRNRPPDLRLENDPGPLLLVGSKFFQLLKKKRVLSVDDFEAGSALVRLAVRSIRRGLRCLQEQPPAVVVQLLPPPRLPPSGTGLVRQRARPQARDQFGHCRPSNGSPLAHCLSAVLRKGKIFALSACREQRWWSAIGSIKTRVAPNSLLYSASRLTESRPTARRRGDNTCG